MVTLKNGSKMNEKNKENKDRGVKDSKNNPEHRELNKNVHDKIANVKPLTYVKSLNSNRTCYLIDDQQENINIATNIKQQPYLFRSSWDPKSE